MKSGATGPRSLHVRCAGAYFGASLDRSVLGLCFAVDRVQETSSGEILGRSMGAHRRRTNWRSRSLLVGRNLFAHRIVNVRNQHLEALVAITRMVRHYFTVAVPFPRWAVRVCMESTKKPRMSQ